MNSSADNPSGDLDYARLPNEQKLLIDRLCSRFEAALKAGSKPRAEAVLKKLPADMRLAALGELLPLEADYRQRDGKPLTLPELEQRFPDVDAAWLARCVRSEAAETVFGASVPVEPETPLPERLGDYRILGRLGSGGMGAVYRAVHERMDREVAVKLLRPEIQKNPMLLQRFDREVRAAAKLSHPNIVAALDAREHDGLHFLVTELVEGRDLDQTVRLTGPLPALEAVDCLLQAARGLSYAHAQGVIHRDIKPANLLRAKDGTVKILDMGLARISNADSSTDVNLTGTGVMMGTAAYMPPEQARDTRKADARSDLYSLGCTLFYLLTGRTAFTGTTQMDMILSHVNQPIPSLREFNPRISLTLDRTFQRLVAKSPEDRFQTADELIPVLQAVLDDCRNPHANQTMVEPLPSIKVDSRGTTASRTADDLKTSVRPSDFNFPATPPAAARPKAAERRAQSRDSKRNGFLLAAVVAGLIIIFGFAVSFFGGGSAAPIDVPIARNGEGGDSREQIPRDDGNAGSLPAADGSSDGSSDPTLRAARLQFNGVSSYAVASSLLPEPGASYTLELRFRPDSIRSGNPSNIVSWLGPDWMAIFVGTNGTVGLARRANDSSNIYTSTQVVRPGLWYHVAASFDRSGMRLFVDGTSVNLTRQQFELPETQGGFFIGGVDPQRLPPDQNDRFFPGLIESVRISRGIRYSANFEPVVSLNSDETTLAAFPLLGSSGSSEKSLSDLENRHTLQLHQTNWTSAADAE